MNRRGFIKQTVQRAGNAIVREVDASANAAAVHWIRPPYALNELEFLLSCTRCGDCIDACPHDVIFPLPARRGAKVAGTPALDLLNKGCHLCKDWPCVTSCETGALQFPDGEQEDIPLPVLAAVSIDTQTCLPYQGPECGACESSCPVSGALVWESFRPRIEAAHCTGCGLCREACIVTPKAVEIRSRYG